MKKFIAVLVLFLCIGTFGLFAEEFSSGVGVSGMSISLDTFAGGLQYLRWFNNIGFQLAGGGAYTPETTFMGNDFDYTVSVDLIYRLYQNEFSPKFSGCLYAWLKAGHRGFTKYEDYNTEDPTAFRPSHFTADFLAGIGFGIDFIFYKHLSVPLEFGYTGEFPNDLSLGFTMGTGIRYVF